MRLEKLDGFRGLTIVSMIGYHALWDVNFIFGIYMAWYGAAPGYVWQQSICWSFILLSGLCACLGENRRSLSGLLRGVEVAGFGALITIVTVIFMPEDRIIFGVLTLIGACKMIVWLIRPVMEKIHPAAGIVMAFFLFIITRHITGGYLGIPAEPSLILAETIPADSLDAAGNLPGLILTLPEALYRDDVTTFFGFMRPGFFSTDYFPLFPWLFLYMAGSWIGIMLRKSAFKEKLRKGICRPLEAFGRKSLLIYILHQPVIYGLLYLFLGR